MTTDQNNIINEVTNSEYKWGFVTDIEMDFLNKLIDKGFYNMFRELHGDKIQYSYYHS